jgi:hypothetical protein
MWIWLLTGWIVASVPLSVLCGLVLRRCAAGYPTVPDVEPLLLPKAASA